MPEKDASCWIKKAEEARTRAGEMHDQFAIRTMLDIAARYDSMAEQIEARSVRGPTRSDTQGPRR